MLGPKTNVSNLLIGPTYGMLKLIDRPIDTCCSACAKTNFATIRINKADAFMYINKNYYMMILIKTLIAYLRPGCFDIAYHFR